MIKSCPANGFISKTQNPNEPNNLEEFAIQAEETIKAGVTSVHFHVFDDKGQPSGDLGKTRALISPLKAKYGDKVVWDGSVASGKTMEEAMQPIIEGLIEIAVVKPGGTFFGGSLTAWNIQWVQAQVELIQSLGAVPKITCHDTGYIDNAKRWLVDTGLLKKPTHWLLAVGMPGLTPMWDPMSCLEALMLMVRRVREADPDAVIMVNGGGRAHHHITAAAVLLGLHGARVGQEDCIYRYAHKDELINSTTQIVKSTMRLVEEMGRRVATAEEYRKMIGLA